MPQKLIGMPRDNIERAIKKGSGESSQGAIMEEILYEGYGAAGTAVICEILTDNRNRTAEVRKIFARSLAAENGKQRLRRLCSIARSLIVIDEAQISEDDLMELLMECDGDYTLNDGVYEVTCAPENFTAVAEALEGKKVQVMEATIRSSA